MPGSRRIDRAAGAAVALTLIALPLIAAAPQPSGTAAQDLPHYDARGRLVLPADYRQWVFLSSGLDMSYSDKPPMDGAHMFNNVFVPRRAYDAFEKTGTWPDKTVLLLENRGGITNRSILKHGQVQTEDVMGLEAHVKDTARFKGGWAFFSFNDKAPAERIAYSASCYSCHQAHGAVDTTFVQFYPTLLPIAKNKSSLSAEYRAEIAAVK